MASTGWKHGFESLKEVRLLVALDFLKVSEVLSQPFRLDFEHAGGHAWHIPDFLAVFGGGMWLLDVRPMELIKEEDALKFAAAREVAAACGWRYSVVAGWRPHVWSVLDHMSSRRRPARDLLGMRDQLLTAISGQQGQAMTFVPRYSSGRWSHRASTSSLHARSKPRSLRKSSNNGPHGGTPLGSSSPAPIHSATARTCATFSPSTRSDSPGTSTQARTPLPPARTRPTDSSILRHRCAVNIHAHDPKIRVPSGRVRSARIPTQIYSPNPGRAGFERAVAGPGVDDGAEHCEVAACNPRLSGRPCSAPRTKFIRVRHRRFSSKVS
jgi:hypothetical protein